MDLRIRGTVGQACVARLPGSSLRRGNHPAGYVPNGPADRAPSSRNTKIHGHASTTADNAPRAAALRLLRHPHRLKILPMLATALSLLRWPIRSSEREGAERVGAVARRGVRPGCYARPRRWRGCRRGRGSRARRRASRSRRLHGRVWGPGGGRNRRERPAAAVAWLRGEPFGVAVHTRAANGIAGITPFVDPTFATHASPARPCGSPPTPSGSRYGNVSSTERCWKGSKSWSASSGGATGSVFATKNTTSSVPV